MLKLHIKGKPDSFLYLKKLYSLAGPINTYIMSNRSCDDIGIIFHDRDGFFGHLLAHSILGLGELEMSHV